MTPADELPPSRAVQRLNEGAWLAAIVDSSDDAILSITLEGVILSWNAAAERLFGYTASEAIGQHISILIPKERWGEEKGILAQLRSGQLVQHFETLRCHKDGSPLDVSLTLSPVRDDSGAIMGASKIARDISVARQHAGQQALLLREMNHRVKNLFAMISGLLALSARDAESVEALAQSFMARIGALDRVHRLTMPDGLEGPPAEGEVDLAGLLATVVAPYDDGRGKCVVHVQEDIGVGPRALPMLALIVHELATNAAKYGALAGAQGSLRISVTADQDAVLLRWEEFGCGPAPTGPIKEGFGSQLLQTAARGLGGQFTRSWSDGGLTATLSALRSRFSV